MTDSLNAPAITAILNDDENMFFILDPDGTIEWSNRASENIFTDQKAKLTFEEIFNLDHRELSQHNKIMTAWSNLNGEKVLCEHKYITEFNNEDKILKIIKTCYAHERKSEAVHQLNKESCPETLNYFKQLIDKSQGMFAYFNREGNMVVSNRLFNSFHRDRFKMVKGANIVKTYKTGLDLSDKIMMRALEEAFKGKSTQNELWHINKGKKLLLQTELFPTSPREGKYEVMLYTRDITDRAHVESQILDAMNDERKRIGIDLHDNLGHSLLAIAIQTKLLKDKIKKCASHVVDEIREIETSIKESLNEVRNLSQGLVPFKKNKLEFKEMLKAVSLHTERTYNLRCDIKFEKEIALTDESLIRGLYYIIEEAIANTAKHSSATRIEIIVGEKDNLGFVQIIDNGGGFNRKNSKKNGIGIEIMRYRSRSIGCNLEIASTTAGSSVTCTFSFKTPCTTHDSQINEIKIVIVEDHPIVADGIKQLINKENDMKVIEAVPDADSAIRTLFKITPDIMIVDISLRGKASGLELIKAIKKRYGKIKTLVLSMHDEGLYAERAIKAGANGYIMKNDLTDNIIRAIRSVLRGDLYLSEEMKTKIINNMGNELPESPDDILKILSDREFQVFQLLSLGKRTVEIARDLNISAKTVAAHRLRIRNKLNFASSSDLFKYALEWRHNKKNA